MHCCGYIITDKIPTYEQIKDILEPYNEISHEEVLEFSWDFYNIGGRYGGKLKIHFDPDKTEENWFSGSKHRRNHKYFISSKLSKLEKVLMDYEELEYMQYMGLRENILYVDGAYFKDIINFDITNCCFVIDKDKTLYSRELWKDNNWITDEQFDEKVKNINLDNKFITVIDIHY